MTRAIQILARSFFRGEHRGSVVLAGTPRRGELFRREPP